MQTAPGECSATPSPHMHNLLLSLRTPGSRSSHLEAGAGARKERETAWVRSRDPIKQVVLPSPTSEILCGCRWQMALTIKVRSVGRKPSG